MRGWERSADPPGDPAAAPVARGGAGHLRHGPVPVPLRPEDQPRARDAVGGAGAADARQRARPLPPARPPPLPPHLRAPRGQVRGPRVRGAGAWSGQAAAAAATRGRGGVHEAGGAHVSPTPAGGGRVGGGVQRGGGCGESEGDEALRLRRNHARRTPCSFGVDLQQNHAPPGSGPSAGVHHLAHALAGETGDSGRRRNQESPQAPLLPYHEKHGQDSNAPCWHRDP
mmetsp:Transcript_495/g.1092  ORF Transcript_495/g.1092 Transcript_495/m.1092 type:complete len:227 (+) Transcript_495:1234-1914(+)